LRKERRTTLKRKAVSEIVLILLIATASSLAFSIQPTRSAEEPPVVEWSKTYGSGSANSVIQTSDGGYALACSGFANFIKIDASGNMQIDKTYGVSASCIVQADDGGYALACSGSANFIKTDANGNLQISEAYGGDASCIVQTNDGGYALAGVLGSDFWLVKIDSVGNVQWSETYGRTYDERAYSLIQSSDGGYVLVGYVNDSGRNCWLVKTDSNGNQQWNKTIGENGGRREGRSIVQTSDGGYAIAIDTYDGAGFGDFWLVKTYAGGSQQWSKTYDGGAGDYSFDVVQTNDGGYALAGERGGGPFPLPGYGDFWLVKTDADGTELWNTAHGGSGYDQAYSLVQTSDGGYALAGYWAGTDCCLVKFSPEQPPPPPPPVPEFPLGSAIPIAAVPLLLYVWWKAKRKTPP
jgi:hypothetical protein